MEEVVWSTGEKYEKSTKSDNPNIIKNVEIENEICKNEIYNNEVYNNEMFSNEIFRINNKREEANNKISERYLVGQMKQNPFMANNNYISDLDVQQHFLIPKNSNT